MRVSVRHIRPHFEVPLTQTGDAALRRIEAHLGSPDAEVEGWVHAPYAELAVPACRRHWWSPRLAMRVETRDGPPTLHCRFQPAPGVWTMYMAGWAMLAVGTMLVIGFGCAQSILGASPTVCLYGLPVAGLAAAGLYASALLGQRLGQHEVDALHAEVHRALGGDFDEG